jgi:hypothetical protein
MKLIFLDFDGVLNSIGFQRGQRAISEMCTAHDIDPKAVEFVKQIMDSSNAKIVVSSSWRIVLTLPELQDVLGEFGIDRSNIIGVTPRLQHPRGDEIEEYINGWPLQARDPIESFVILDDDGDMGKLYHRLIHTSYNFGLNENHVGPALEILAQPWEPELELT